MLILKPVDVFGFVIFLFEAFNFASVEPPVHELLLSLRSGIFEIYIYVGACADLFTLRSNWTLMGFLVTVFVIEVMIC